MSKQIFLMVKIKTKDGKNVKRHHLCKDLCGDLGDFFLRGGLPEILEDKKLSTRSNYASFIKLKKTWFLVLGVKIRISNTCDVSYVCNTHEDCHVPGCRGGNYGGGFCTKHGYEWKSKMIDGKHVSDEKMNEWKQLTEEKNKKQRHDNYIKMENEKKIILKQKKRTRKLFKNIPNGTNLSASNCEQDIIPNRDLIFEVDVHDEDSIKLVSLVGKFKKFNKKFNRNIITHKLVEIDNDIENTGDYSDSEEDNTIDAEIDGRQEPEFDPLKDIFN